MLALALLAAPTLSLAPQPAPCAEPPARVTSIRELTDLEAASTTGAFVLVDLGTGEAIPIAKTPECQEVDRPETCADGNDVPAPCGIGSSPSQACGSCDTPTGMFPIVRRCVDTTPTTTCPHPADSVSTVNCGAAMVGTCDSHPVRGPFCDDQANGHCDDVVKQTCDIR